MLKPLGESRSRHRCLNLGRYGNRRRNRYCRRRYVIPYV